VSPEARDADGTSENSGIVFRKHNFFPARLCDDDVVQTGEKRRWKIKVTESLHRTNKFAIRSTDKSCGILLRRKASE